jgi:hypothetical protein
VLLKRKFTDGGKGTHAKEEAKMIPEWLILAGLGGVAYYTGSHGTFDNFSWNPSDWFPERRVDLDTINQETFQELTANEHIRQEFGEKLTYEDVTLSGRPKVFLIEEDMSTGYLLRFVIRGEKGSCYAHVEISNQLPKGTYRYAFLQNLSNQKYLLLCDNRKLNESMPDNLRGKWNSGFKVIYLPLASGFERFIERPVSIVVENVHEQVDKIFGKKK